jgi:hypothetical protein
MISPIYVGYYTNDTLYTNEFKRLEKQLKKYKLEYDFTQIESLGSWQKNTQFKPVFLMGMFKKYKRPMVYLDVDSDIKQYPIIFDYLDNYDFGVHYIDWEKYKKANKTGFQLDSAVLYFANNAKTAELLTKWQATCEMYPKIFDQKCLEIYLKDAHPKYKIYYLPAFYCKIYDDMSEIKNTVIQQLQISRKVKK